MLSRRGLGLPHWNGGREGAKSQTEHQSTDDQLCEGEAGAQNDGSNDSEDTTDGDGADSAQYVAQFQTGEGSEHAANGVKRHDGSFVPLDEIGYHVQGWSPYLEFEHFRHA